MENTYSKAGKTNNQREPVNTVPIKMPKNIRQIGNIGSRRKLIYVEDYVMTFMKQLSDKEHTGCRIAVLLGYYIRAEEGENIFIKGAVEMQDTDFSNGIAFSDEGWTSIYENIKKYFTDVEIVGWCLIGPEFFLEGMEKIRKIHMENFSGPDKILLKIDNIEKEESFYINENNQLVKQPGYYIYYEKNEEMQNYMVENKDSVSEEKNYNDRATKKIRNIIQEKKDPKDDRNIIRLLYGASTLLAIIVLVIAATMLDNYAKMENMEKAITTISKHLTMSNDKGSTPDKDNSIQNNTSSDSTLEDKNSPENRNKDANVETDDAIDDTDEDADLVQKQEKNTMEQETDGKDPENNQDTMDVDTISGNIDKKEEAKGNDSKKDAENAGSQDKGTGKAENKGTESGTKKADNTSGQKASDQGSNQASANVKYYTVKKGDSLASISYNLYHTFRYMDEIKELNGIEDEDKILAGQKLIVP